MTACFPARFQGFIHGRRSAPTVGTALNLERQGPLSGMPRGAALRPQMHHLPAALPEGAGDEAAVAPAGLALRAEEGGGAPLSRSLQLIQPPPENLGEHVALVPSFAKPPQGLPQPDIPHLLLLK